MKREQIFPSDAKKQNSSDDIKEIIRILNSNHKALIVYLIPEGEQPKEDLLRLLEALALDHYLCFVCFPSGSDDEETMEPKGENLFFVSCGRSILPAIKGLSLILLSTKNISRAWAEELNQKFIWFHADVDTPVEGSEEIFEEAGLISYFTDNENTWGPLAFDVRSLPLHAGAKETENPDLWEEKMKTLPKGWQAYANLNLQDKIAVMTATFLDFDGAYFYCGGAERYLLDLSEICEELHRELVIFQYGNCAWMRRFKNVDIVSLSKNGFKADGWILKCAREFNRNFFDYVDGKTALNIYSAFYEAWPIAASPNIGISHGVSWDNPYCDFENAFEFWLMNGRYIEGAKACEELISVDTNSANWFQTVDFDLSQRIKVIPNYVDLSVFKPRADYLEKKDKTVILYPRQLYSARGLYLVLEILDDILEQFPGAEFHFVGRGGEYDMHQVAEKQKKWPGRVVIKSMPMEEMPQVYRNADIALIPSLHSEGTSLSCLEAMASGNAVIATRIGGLSDLIINRYNGLLIEPHPEDLKQAIIRLLENDAQLSLYKKRSLESAEAFSKTLWRERWKSILENKLNQKPPKKMERSRVVEIKLKKSLIDDKKSGEMILEFLKEGALVYVRADTVPDPELSFARIQWLAPDAPLFSPCDQTIEI